MADVHGTEQQRTEQNNTAPPVVPSTAATSTTQATPATSAGGSIPASTPAHQPAAQGVATSAATSTSNSAALGGTSTSTATQSPLPSIIPVNANDQGIDMWRLPPDSIQRQGSEPPPPPLPRNKAVQWSQGAVTQNQGQWMAAAQPTVMQPSGPQQAVPPPAPQAGVGLHRQGRLVQLLTESAHRLARPLPLVRVDLVMSLKHGGQSELADTTTGGTNLPPEIGQIFFLVSCEFQQEFSQLLGSLIVQNIDVGLRGSLLLVFCSSQH